ncbi:Valine--tRNA ligase, mitochondrial [Triplophysa tibetana]|uniref:Valine--tRNA ligase, mitochondrial n=1 Tax=Triplophysa tibetana TaxID=1572043 RepID=A0A5A9NLM3_9TELE|nr:Valine--tRNA ligase, mitochondrial [Triplophysa tibetana]
MWKRVHVVSPRIWSKDLQKTWSAWGYRLCSSAHPPASSNTPSTQSRTQAEKAKRRREKEKTILSSGFNDVGPVWSEKEKIKYTAALLPGEKKDTSLPFPQSYSPEYVEFGWYQWWEKEGFFSPEQHGKQPHATDKYFSFCIPPPNVTGNLHLGHALTVAIEDALARWRRMQGYKVLWVPGCDHAGIATQSVVERKLLREHGKLRQDYSRDEFLKEVWRWKNEKGDEIYHQLRKLGASLDWTRPCFTMDPGFSSAVTEAFVRLCDSGLIYRSEGLVNWSCALESAISDIEVDSKELSGKTLLSVPGYQQKVEFGTIVTFAYLLEGQEGEVAVSTTRPETMLGDLAIAVHPNDPRYQDLHGKYCRHPFTDRLLPIIADTMVDMKLGTGAVKVTPAHDHTDFLLSQRHALPRLTVIGGDGTMTSLCGQWLEGVKRFDARERVISALMERKLFRNKQSHPMSLPICRQLWWGHQIPAYRVTLQNSVDTEEELWVWGRTAAEARERAAVKFGVNPDHITLTQDPDVLDTWFSSALFPFAMLGWPQQKEDLKQFYPNSILETGSDLIFFWVARMVMLGKELTGQLPFKQRLQKKIKEGNLDPRESVVAMEAQEKDFPKGIPECGTDALRFALCSYKAQGDDISLSVSHVLSCRHFCNKMWQAVRFTLAALQEASSPASLAETHPVSSMDRWICSRLYSTVRQCEEAFESYELHTITSALHSFWVHSLCDVYLESIKPVLKQEASDSMEQKERERQVAMSVLYHSVSISLCLLSPFMPFLTEELWQRLLPYSADSIKNPTSLCVQPYPKTSQLEHWYFPEEEADFSLAQEVVRVARLLRAQCQMTKEKPDLWAVCAPDQAQTLLHFRSAICTLGRISKLRLHCPDGGFTDSPPPKGSVVGVVDHSIRLYLSVQTGFNADKQRALLCQRRAKLANKLKQAISRTHMPNYTEKVPDRVRQEMDNKIAAMEEDLKNIEDQLLDLEDMKILD